MTSTRLSRQECAVTVLGGPTAVIDMGGLRIVSDPTFDEPGPQGYLTKTAGPAVSESALGPVDLVLVSHDLHPDNFDKRGRAFAGTAPLVLTGPLSAARLGQPAIGLSPWTSHSLLRRDGGGELTVLAVPAVHGPEDGERDADGYVNCGSPGSSCPVQGSPRCTSAETTPPSVRWRKCPAAYRTSARRCCTPERHAYRPSSKGALCPWTAGEPRLRQPSWMRTSWCLPTTTAGLTSPRDWPTSNWPSMKPACRRSYVLRRTDPG